MTVLNEVRRGFYLDSVALMRFSKTIAAMAGVEEAALMMGTPSNRQILADADLLATDCETAGGGDLIIGIRAVSADAAAAALARAVQLIDRPSRGSGAGEAWRPRTIRTALKAMPGANLALISVPGDFAAAEARKALGHGLDVMVFSDNVPLTDEVALKREARALGQLVMGPDCGTAILDGVPLGFANVVPRGDIAIIGASGTGTQEVSCLIARGGGGISQAIGVGGRDLDDAVGGISTLMALDALDADPATRHVVIVAKPPSPAVADAVVAPIGASGKSITVCFVGAEGWTLPANARFASTLKAAAEDALGGRRIGDDFDVDAMATAAPANASQVRGLYAGGTLCAEAQAVLRAAGEAVTSNAPIPGVPNLADAATEHRLIDLGSDEYTRGRPHPMIDPSVRDGALGEALDDPAVGVLLLDVVIGFGAHGDPAGHLVDGLRRRGGPLVVASVTGTDGDPQGRARQVAKLESAGVLVAPSNADAAALALACLRHDA